MGLGRGRRQVPAIKPRLDRHPCDAVGLRARRGTQTQVRVYDRRIPKQDVLLPSRSAGLGNRRDRAADQGFGGVAGAPGTAGAGAAPGAALAPPEPGD